ncbi:hypothetical protein CMO92_04565 [Candidatus Woesearchaeota archaeon]|nr:hypothetical protein [Candidatus Woesearchaeota archaeon]
MGFEEMFIRLENMGLSDVLLPFLLIFVVVYAVLQKVKIFGTEKDKNKPYSVTIALVLALAVVIPHITGRYPPGKDVVEIMNSALPNISLFLVAILCLLIILGLLGDEVNIAGGSLASWAVLISLLAVVVIFGGAAGWFGTGFPWGMNFLRDPDTQALVTVILVFGIIIYFITHEPDDSKKEDGFWKELGKTLKK